MLEEGEDGGAVDNLINASLAPAEAPGRHATEA